MATKSAELIKREAVVLENARANLLNRINTEEKVKSQRITRNKLLPFTFNLKDDDIMADEKVFQLCLKGVNKILRLSSEDISKYFHLEEDEVVSWLNGEDGQNLERRKAFITKAHKLFTIALDFSRKNGSSRPPTAELAVREMERVLPAS